MCARNGHDCTKPFGAQLRAPVGQKLDALLALLAQQRSVHVRAAHRRLAVVQAAAQRAGNGGGALQLQPDAWRRVSRQTE